MRYVMMAVIYLTLSSFLVNNFVFWQMEHCPEPHTTLTEAAVLTPVMPFLFVTGVMVAPFYKDLPSKCNK